MLFEAQWSAQMSWLCGTSMKPGDPHIKRRLLFPRCHRSSRVAISNPCLLCFYLIFPMLASWFVPCVTKDHTRYPSRREISVSSLCFSSIPRYGVIIFRTHEARCLARDNSPSHSNSYKFVAIVSLPSCNSILKNDSGFDIRKILEHKVHGL